MSQPKSETAPAPVCWSWLEPGPVRADPWGAVVLWQAGRCAICGTADLLVRDHDHYTGRRRGLLCRGCNVHEGFCWDSSCRCAAYRYRPPAAIVGVDVEHGGWTPISRMDEDANETSARVARIRNRRSVL